MLSPRNAVTGIQAFGPQQGLRLTIDGRDIGPLPQKVTDIAEGEHTVRVAAGDRFAALEKRVTVRRGELTAVGPVKLRVLRGLATIVAGPGADKAQVLLVSGTARQRLPMLPISLDIPTDGGSKLAVRRRGYEPFEIPLVFEDGHAERTFPIEFIEPTWGDKTDEQQSTKLDGAVLGRIVSGLTPSVRRVCWDARLSQRDANAPASAKVTVQFSIAPSGLVENVSTSGDPAGYPGLAECIERSVRSWRLPRPSGTVTAKFPFVFAAS